MSNSKVVEGDLVAYLSKEKIPAVEVALHTDPELGIELNELREFDVWLQKSFGGIDSVDPQLVVDVVAGQASRQQQLLVSAVAQKSPRIRKMIETLRKEYNSYQSASPTLRLKLPQFIATLQLAAVGLRSSSETSQEATYHADEVDVQVMLTLSPLVRGKREIHGLVTVAGIPAQEGKAVLISETTKGSRRLKIKQGSFVFRDVVADSYHLKIQLAQGSIAIPDSIHT